MNKKVLFGFCCALATYVGSAQSFVGSWSGDIEAMPNVKLELIFHIEKEGDVYKTTLDVPAQGASGIETKTSVKENEIVLSVGAIGLSYHGTLKGESVIEGEFEQNGFKLPLTLRKKEQTKPGDLSLVSSREELDALAALDKGDYKYSIADYFSKPEASSFQISPDGTYLSYKEKDKNGKSHVYVKEIASGKVTRVIEEKEELIRGYVWINKSRLAYFMDKGGDENYHVYAVDIDGKNEKDLTPYDGVKAFILNLLKEQPDYIIVQLNKDNKQIFEPYKLNVVTGDLEKLYSNNDPNNSIQGYDFDKDGNLRGFSRLKDGIQNVYYYKSAKDDDYQPIKTTDWNDVFSIIAFNYASTNPDEAYVLTNLEGDKTEIVLYDLAQNKEIKKVFSNPDYDVSGMSLSRKRNYELDAFFYEGDKAETVPVSDFYKRFDALAKKQFPGKEVSIVDKDDDEKTLLVLVDSDKDYGSYYVYKPDAGEMTLLFQLRPQLKEEDMAEMRPISFKSRDGLTIHAYITLPKAALEGKKVPLIVNPHGGPQGIRDSWGFNPEAQLFASRGYATLQVNFRISGGYGKNFLRSGFKQIGRKAMDDLEDGVKYVLSQGWVDPDRIAIYGGSHGGYATLMGLVKTPELYACGVDYVGVSNIFTFFESFPEYWKPFLKMVKEIWYDLDDPKEAAIAKEVSPIFQVDKIKAPLFVVQGANDPRVNIHESDQIVKALRAKGYAVPYMVKYNEGHGYHHEENRLDLYRCMMGFFHKHLKGN